MLEIIARRLTDLTEMGQVTVHVARCHRLSVSVDTVNAGLDHAIVADHPLRSTTGLDALSEVTGKWLVRHALACQCVRAAEQLEHEPTIEHLVAAIRHELGVTGKRTEKLVRLVGRVAEEFGSAAHDEGRTTRDGQQLLLPEAVDELRHRVITLWQMAAKPTRSNIARLIIWQLKLPEAMFDEVWEQVQLAEEVHERHTSMTSLYEVETVDDEPVISRSQVREIVVSVRGQFETTPTPF